jgi:two-component sensor histidine kinase
MHIMTTIPSQLPFPQGRLLLHELNHRIGNEFCCAVSVVSLAAARSNNKEVKAALTDVAELLHHYAEAHHALQIPEHSARTRRPIFASCACRSGDPS